MIDRFRYCVFASVSAASRQYRHAPSATASGLRSETRVGAIFCRVHASSRLFDDPQPSDKLAESHLIKLANPVLPIFEHPKLVGVGADLVVVARLQEEDVRRRVAEHTAGWVVAIASTNHSVALVRLKVSRRLGKAQHVATTSFALTWQAPRRGARLPLHVPANVVRNLVSVQAQDVNVRTNTPLGVATKAIAVLQAVVINILVEA